MKIIDISGQTFHDVEVLSYNEKRSGGSLGAYFNCRCRICGKTFVRRGYDIRTGRVRNCGCTKVRKGSREGLGGSEGYVGVNPDSQKKYGCVYCKDRKACGGQKRCKYADILDKYPDYKAYDEEAKRLFVSLGLDE